MAGMTGGEWMGRGWELSSGGFARADAPAGPGIGGNDVMRHEEQPMDIDNSCVWIPPDNHAIKAMTTDLEERLRRDPRDFWAWDNLANLCFSAGYIRQSIGIYKKALEIRPDIAVVHLRIGIAYYREARLDEATDSLAHALAIDPDIAMAHYYLGFVHYHKGDSEASLAHFRRLHELSPETRIVLYHMAEAHLQAADYERAVPLLRELLEHRPNAAMAWYKLGLAEFGMHRNQEAVKAFRQALRCNPQDQRSANMIELITDVPNA